MSLKRSIFYTFLTQAPNLFLFFIASTLMTRVLGDEGRGAYALLQNQTALLSMLLGFNLGFGITYFTSKDHGDPRRMVRIAASAICLNLVVVPILLAMIYWNTGLRQLFLPKEAAHWAFLLYVLFTVILGQITSFIGNIMLGMKKFRMLNRMSIFNAALSATGFTILYLLRNRIEPTHVLPLVLAVALSCVLLQSILWCIIYIRVVGILPIPEWDWSVLRPFLAFVLVGYVSNIINLINYRFDIWVVGSYAGTAQLGLYAVAVGMGQLFFYVPEPFSRVVQPYLYGDMDKVLLDKFKFIVRINLTSVAVLSIMLGGVAPWLIPLLFGKTFTGSVIALQWLLPGIVFVSGSKLISLLVVQGGYIRFNLVATAIAAALTIALDLVLIPRWGILGASIASSISYLALLVVPFMVIRYKMHIPIWDMLFLRPSDLARIRALVFARLPFLTSK
ncbi:MAG: polysaccharide biosynthesis C-terminal domain-containing protein [Flavobacteriales bacterium]|nr:polysaccharide biosynthesis C-terminal domain-containing protein [Flavobacteriales bacterium]